MARSGSRLLPLGLALDVKVLDSLLLYGLQCGVAADIGGRASNDDAYTLFSTEVPGRPRCTVVAVLDGHHHDLVARAARDELPRAFVAAQRAEPDLLTALAATVAALEEHVCQLYAVGAVRTGGTTLLVHVLTGGGRLFTANVGDCRGVLSVRGASEALNTPHNPDVATERERFAEAGVGVSADFIACSDINVCRSIGDWDIGSPIKWRDERGHTRGPLIADPELSVREVDVLDEFLVVGSDGLWDYYSPESSVVSDARRVLRARGGDAQACAEWLVQQALLRQRATLHAGTPGDNVTAVVVTLRPLPRLPRHRSSRLNLRIPPPEEVESLAAAADRGPGPFSPTAASGSILPGEQTALSVAALSPAPLPPAGLSAALAPAALTPIGLPPAAPQVLPLPPVLAQPRHVPSMPVPPAAPLAAPVPAAPAWRSALRPRRPPASPSASSGSTRGVGEGTSPPSSSSDDGSDGALSPAGPTPRAGDYTASAASSVGPLSAPLGGAAGGLSLARLALGGLPGHTGGRGGTGGAAAVDSPGRGMPQSPQGWSTGIQLPRPA